MFTTAFALACLAGAGLVGGQERSSATAEPMLFSPADVEQAFKQIPAKPPTNRNIVEQEHYQVAVARVAGRNGPPEHHRDSDRVFFVKSGKAVMRVGGQITDPQEVSPGEIRSASGAGYRDYREVTMEAGAIISAPRGVPYQIIAKDGDVSFVVVRIK